MIWATCKPAKQRIMDAFMENAFMIKPVIILAVIYLIAISAILRSNFNYVDDMGRVRLGYAGWGNYSRYLSVFLSYFLHADTYLTDISPLPQIIAAFIMALASVAALHIISDAKQFSFWHLIAALPMGLSPYFLSCFSYKYDSPYMALSVLLSVLPLLFYKRSWILFALLTISGAIGMCITYQASAGIFPMLVIMVCIKRWIGKDSITEILKFIIFSATSYLIGLVLFHQFLMAEEINYASTTLLPLTQLIPNAIKNYKLYLLFLLCDFKTEWLIFVLVICVSFFIASISSTQQHKVITGFISILVLFALFILSFGVYPFLTDPIYMPRAMYGVGCYIAFLGMYVLTTAPKIYPAKLACLLLSWAFLVFSFTYGNALYVQSTYTDYRISAVIDDLRDSDVLTSNNVKIVRITGSIGFSPVIQDMPQDSLILYRLVPITFAEGDMWGSFGFLNYYGLPYLEEDETIDLSSKDLPVITDNYFHTIRADEGYIWIDLHGAKQEIPQILIKFASILGISEIMGMPL